MFFLFSISADKQQILVRQHFERRWVSRTMLRYRKLIFRDALHQPLLKRSWIKQH